MTNDSFQATKSFELPGGIKGTLEISVAWPTHTLWPDPQAVAELLWLDAQTGLLTCQRSLLEQVKPKEALP